MNPIASWLIDMDGVPVREEHPILGADCFLARFGNEVAPFLVLTNDASLLNEVGAFERAS